jgi:hypothetical protein
MGACEAHATLEKLNSLADSQNLSQLVNKIYDVQIWMALLVACRLMVGNYPYNITYPRGESFACLRRKVKQATARLHIQHQYGARETRIRHEQNDKMTCPALAVHYHLIGIYRGRHKRGQTDEL